MKKVVLYGNGSVANAVYFLLTHDSPYQVSAFTVDRAYITEDTLFDLPVVPFDSIASTYPPGQHDMFIAVGHVRINRIRAERYARAKEMGYRLINYVSSRSSTWPGLVLGDNCKIGAHSTIGAFAQLGNNVNVGSGSNVGHHTVIKDHCSLAPGVTVAGNVTLEPYCLVGAGAVIRDRITIARECVIGAGAVILEDTQARGVYLGRPAELLPLASDQLPLG